MDVSIIIVNYKTISLVVNCIRSIILHTSGLSWEVIVVDNNSGDDCRGALDDFFSSNHNIRIVNLFKNIGFGGANNEGFKLVTGRNVFCLNPDTVLLNNAIKILSDYLDSHLDVGVCGGNLYDEQMKPTLSYMTFLPSITHEIDELLHGKISRLKNGNSTIFNHTDRVLSCGYITGADMMIRHSIIDEVGGFSPAFFMYYEETELTYRIKKAGYRICSVPDAKIQHLEGKSFKQTKLNERRISLSEQSRSIYYRLHYSLLYRIIANSIYGLFLISRYYLFMLKGNSKAAFFKCRLSYFNIV